MAKLSAHGSELARIEFFTYQLSYREDGKILRNDGQGWKRWKKCKPEIAPVDAAARALAAYEASKVTHPCWFDYRAVLHSLVGRDRRSVVHHFAGLLRDDVDGLWSELNDTLGLSVGLEDCQRLAAAYRAMQSEKGGAK